MTVNQYIKKWCEENYTPDKEDFYVDNANYVIARSWASGGWKHGIFGLFVSLIGGCVGVMTGNILEVFFTALIYLGISAVCFWVFAARRYNENCKTLSTSLYCSLFIVLVSTQHLMPLYIRILFALGSCTLFVCQSIINPIEFIKIKRAMKKRILDNEDAEAKSDAEKHTQWEKSYQNARYGIPEFATPDQGDPMLEEAKSLFIGYTKNKKTLKARYRELAKQYHPDKGGDTRFFQFIVNVYEELDKVAA